MILRSLHKKAPPLQKLTAKTPGTQRFPSIARCVCCAAVVTWPFCSRLIRCFPGDVQHCIWCISWSDVSL